MEMVKGLEHLSHEERQRSGVVQLEGKKAQVDLIYVYKHLVGRVKKIDPDSSQWCPLTRMRSKEHKLRYRKSHLKEKTLLLVRLVKHWHRLPGEAVVAPSSELFKSQLDTALSKVLQLTLLWAGNWMISRGACPPHLFCGALIGVYKGFLQDILKKTVCYMTSSVIKATKNW